MDKSLALLQDILEACERIARYTSKHDYDSLDFRHFAFSQKIDPPFQGGLRPFDRDFENVVPSCHSFVYFFS